MRILAVNLTLWLLTFCLLTMYLWVFRTLCSGVVHLKVDFMVFWSFKPALRAFRGVLGLWKRYGLTYPPLERLPQVHRRRVNESSVTPTPETHAILINFGGIEGRRSSV